LIEAFTNPLAFAAAGTSAAAQIVQGTTHQIGSEIDEFVTGALRNNLLGLPLDLAALNIARGRDTGVPPINLVRNEIYSQTHDTNLKPYANWDEFRQFLKHDASIINFVAAYGTHASIIAATTLADKRAAALDLVTMGIDPASQTGDAAHQDAFNFMHSLGAYANDVNNPLAVHAQWSTGSITGLDNVDLWIGGLAEKQNLFGGLLGSTFNFIFETQLESLQDGDRLYYLPRIEGIHFGSEIEANSFAELIMQNTGAKHLSASIFLTPEYTVEAGTVTDDPATWLRNPVTGALLVEKLADGTVHFIGDDNFFGNTMVLGGTEGDDRLQAGQADDDTVWGDGGNDWIDGGNGNDFLYGGTGNDIITDSAGDDVIHGDAGNDTVSGGLGADIIFGGDGDDFLDGGQGIDSIVGGLGNDIIKGGEDDDELEGNEGDDWIEGGDGGDLIVGDQGAPTGQVPLIQGNDVLIGGTQGDRMQGFSGDDIMLGLGGFDKFEGRLGYDWASFEQEDHGVSVDMERREFVDQPQALGGDAIRDFFIETEAISGSKFGDFLQGTVDSKVDPFNELSNVNLITGLADYFPEGPVAFSGGNIMLGGGGSDFLEGRGGNDIIDGDARLHVALTSDAAGAQIIREILFDQVNRPVFDPATGDVLSAGDIDTAVFSDVSANYQIALATDPITGEVLLGTDGNPVLQVTHTPVAGGGGGAAAVGNDGTDTLYNIERLQFADQTIENLFASFVSDRVAQGTLSLLDNGAPVDAATVITVGDTLTFTANAINDFEGVLVNGVLDAATAGPERIDIPLNELNFQWQYQDQAGVGGARPPSWIAIAGATGPSFTPTDTFIGVPLRVVATFTDGLGVKETIVSAPTSLVVTNPAINHAPTIVTQVAQPGLPDTTGHEDTPLGTVARPGISLPLITVFTDDTTPANQLIYTATLANGAPLATAGLAFSVVLDTAGLVLAGKVTGTPLPGFAGPIDIRVKATDAAGLSVTDTFTINVLPVNDGSAPLSITGTPLQGEILTAVLGADPDGPGTTPSFQWLRDGIAIANAKATTFTLTAADIGHKISVKAAYVDGQGFAENVTSAQTGVVTDPVGLAPVVLALSSIASENGPIVADLLSGASDPNANPLSVVGLDTTVTTTGGRVLALGTDFVLTGATLSLTTAGFAKFDGLKQGATDSATFHFGVTDGTFVTPNALSLTVNGVNDAPAASSVFESKSGQEDVQISGALLAGSDVDGDALQFQVVSGSVTHGSVSINATTGEYVFTPAANYAGPASFSYVVNDGTASSAAKTVFLTVNPVDDGAAPLTITGTAAEGQTLSAVLSADPDGVGSTPVFQWLRDGIAITGATAATLLLSAADVGHAISATAAYTDGQGFADLAQSSATGAVLATAGTTLIGTNAANTLNGTGGNDTLSGLGGNDALNGLAGNDVLLGGAGADTLNGGDGNDTLTGGTGNDRVNGGNGNDTINYTVGDGADTIDGGADTDTLSIFGTARNETLTVAYNGASITSFNDGNSTSTVTGVEAINVDLLGRADTLSYGTSAAGVTVNLGAGSASGFASIANILNVTGGNGDDALTGDGAANTLNGGTGNDTLTGGGGNDTLNGGNGNDRFMATLGDGNDTMNGGAGIDTYDLSATFAAAAINLSSGRASSPETGNDRLSNIENVLGSQGANTITGDNGANVLEGLGGNDIIGGGSGADTLVGGAGDDRLTGGAGNDTFVFRAGFGNDVVTDFHFNGNTFNAGNANHDTLDLHGLGLANIADLIAHSTFTTAGGVTTTHITVGTETITLQGADIRLLNTAAHVGDFIF
jgi:Ca2+-binding RTX toxin-like protein